MNNDFPRLRMFAGPNGSGKSSFKSMIRPELLGIYVNPDEIEKEIRERDFVDFKGYGLQVTAEETLSFFRDSQLLKQTELADEVHDLRFFMM